MRQLVHGFKYHGRRDVLRPLGRCLAAGARLGSVLEAGERPLVVAVPARPKSRRTRGYDQAALLGEAFADVRHLAWAPRALRRRRGGDPRQAGSSWQRRRRQARAAFAARPALVGGRSVLLVDDVMSTGATADAAARALRLAGATRVSVLVLAT